MGNAIIETRKSELVAGSAIAPIIPRDIGEVARLAEGVCKAGLAPDSYKNDPSKVMIGLMKALELGVPPLEGLAGIAIINGRPSVWGDLAVALAQRNGLLAGQETVWTGTENADDWTCAVRIWRRGVETPFEGVFSVKQAKLAKLWANPSKPPWMLYPARMLFNRARAFALRDGFADCLKGLAIAEEAQDLPAVTPIANATAGESSPGVNSPEPAPGVDLTFLEDEQSHAE